MKIQKKSIEKLIEFLPYFSAINQSEDGTNIEKFNTTFSSIPHQVRKFIRTLDETSFLVISDQGKDKEIQALLKHDEIADADLATLRMLMAAIINKCKLVKELIPYFAKDGTAIHILQRLQVLVMEPKLSDEIYEEMRQCEDYALINLITYEAAIRNTNVIKILAELDSYDRSGYPSSKLFLKVQKLKEEYLFDYYAYKTYQGQKLGEERTEDMSHKFHTRDEGNDLHVHYNILPFCRPKMIIPQGENIVRIEIPISHIRIKDIASYYRALIDKQISTLNTEIKDYYDTLDLDKGENKAKSRGETYAQMFFVWDYVKWWKGENEMFTLDMTSRMLYTEISEMIGVTANNDNGRSPKVEKYLEVMTKLIDKCEYKQYYVDEN